VYLHSKASWFPGQVGKAEGNVKNRERKEEEGSKRREGNRTKHREMERERETEKNKTP